MFDVIQMAARDLRKNQTTAEKILWKHLRKRRMKGARFLRQHPLRFEIDGQNHFFIPDFYSRKYNLVTEVDGPVHEEEKDYDDARDKFLRISGRKVMRFKNDQIFDDVDNVLEQIEDQMRCIEKVQTDGD